MPDPVTRVDPGLDLVTLGECMAVLVPDEPGPVRTAARLRLGTAGSESNVAIGLARLGHRVAWVGRVGDDELGARVLRDLRAEGVRVHAPVDPTASTGLMVKEPQPGGGVRVRYYRAASAGSRLGPEDLDPGLVESARHLHVTGITPALSTSARAAVANAVDRAERAGVSVSVDLNLRRTLCSDAEFVEAVRPLVERATLVLGGAEEAAALLGVDEQDPDRLAHGLAGLGPRQVVIKGGAGDSVALVDGELYRRAAVRVAVVNTVGAGDAFVAGWLHGQLRGEPVEQRLRTALLCGAYACTVPGDWEGTLTAADLARLGGPTGDDVIR